MSFPFSGVQGCHFISIFVVATLKQQVGTLQSHLICLADLAFLGFGDCLALFKRISLPLVHEIFWDVARLLMVGSFLPTSSGA